MYKKKSPTFTAGDVKEIMVDQLLNTLQEARDNDWQYKKAFFGATEFPYNPATGTRYSGVNTIMLLSKGFPDARFITPAQISMLHKETDGEIRIMKGSKASQVVYYNFLEKIKENEETGEEEKTKIPMFKYHNVFNFSQIVGPIDQFYPAKEPVKLNDNEQNAFVEEVKEAMIRDGLSFHHHDAGEAFYRPGTDSIHIPHLGQFDSTSAYCRTALHEMGHATGHSSRLNRDQTGRFGSQDYAFEELVAEYYSFFMNLKTGHAHEMGAQMNHGSYANHWLDVITSDREKGKEYVSKAISQASRAFDYVETKVLELQLSKEEKVESKIDIKPTEHQVERKKFALSM